MKHFLCVLVLVGSAVPHCIAGRVVHDELGRTVTVPDHPHRIICLVPSITDAVFSLGAADDVAAVSDYVEFPVEAKKKPSVGSITTPSYEIILSLHSDLILGTPRMNEQATLDQLERLGIPVFLVDPHGLVGILHSITALGIALNREPQAAALTLRLQRRIDAVRAATQGRAVITIGRGAFISEIIDVAGGHSITEDMTEEWPQISMETVIARAPASLLLVRGGQTTLDLLESKPGWNNLPAVKARRAYYVDKRIAFPSPIAIDALEDLARQFHP
jgi:ABC-type Fe3+-hydroxamate transport system substrate-binding protein